MDNDFDGTTDAENIKPIVFDTAQAAFLAGYASASYSTAKKVGTFGGMNFPTVSIFMDGFAQGVEYWNAEKGDTVEVLGWDRAAQDGVFTGGFAANQDAINAAQGLVDQGVDVLLPVGGPIYQSAASVIRDSGSRDRTPRCRRRRVRDRPDRRRPAPHLDPQGDRRGRPGGRRWPPARANSTTRRSSARSRTRASALAPFHDFESKVSPDLQGELDTIEAGIIDGSIPVESYLAG